jgi:hypothetical protein
MEEIRIWWDAEDANPAQDLKAILEELGLAGARVAVELNTHGLTGWNLWQLQKTLDGFCTLDNDDHLIRRLRLVKSPAEIAYTRKAAELLDRSLEAVIAMARPGILDSALKAEYRRVILEGGADMPPNAPLFNSGRHRRLRALHLARPRPRLPRRARGRGDPSRRDCRAGAVRRALRRPEAHLHEGAPRRRAEPEPALGDEPARSGSAAPPADRAPDGPLRGALAPRAPATTARPGGRRRARSISRSCRARS